MRLYVEKIFDYFNSERWSLVGGSRSLGCMFGVGFLGRFFLCDFNLFLVG